MTKKAGTPDGMILSWFREGMNTHEIALRLGIKEYVVARTLHHERNVEYNAAPATEPEQPVEGDKTGEDVQIP